MIKLDHLVVKVSDLAAGLVFYKSLFEYAGFSEIADPSDSDCIGLRQPDGLTIWVKLRNDIIGTEKGVLDHFAFHCESRAEVDNAFDFCLSQGWDILSEPKAYEQYGDFYGFAFSGFDGLKMEFVTR